MYPDRNVQIIEFQLFNCAYISTNCVYVERISVEVFIKSASHSSRRVLSGHGFVTRDTFNISIIDYLYFSVWEDTDPGRV